MLFCSLCKYTRIVFVNNIMFISSDERSSAMLMWQHAFFGALGGFLLLPFFSWQYALVFFAASVFIDADHYLSYVIKCKDWNPFRAFRYHVGNLECELCIFHTIECFLALFVIGFYFPVFFFVLAGFVFHVVCDYGQGRDILANVFVRYPSLFLYPFFKKFEVEHNRGWVNRFGRPNLHIDNIIAFHRFRRLGRE